MPEPIVPAEPSPTAQGRRPAPAVLVSLGIIGPVAIHLIVPALPDLQRDFGVTYTTTQLLISLFVIAFGVGQLLIGPLADMFGRRKVMISGLSVFAATSVLCALASSIEALIVLRVLQGLSACTGIVLARAMVRDYYDVSQATRVLGYLAMGVALGPILAPIIGGLMFETTGWRGPFWFMAAVATVGVGLGIVLVDATLGVRGGESRFRKLLRDIVLLRRNRPFLLQAGGVCCNAGLFYAFVVGAPYVSSEFLDLAPAGYGFWFATVAIGYASGNFVAGRLTGRFASDAVVLFAAAAISLLSAWLLVAFAAGLYSRLVTFGTMALITFASGLLMPNALAGALSACPGLAGSASGLMGFAQFAFAAVVSSCASLLLDAWRHPAAMALPMLVAAALGTLAALALRARKSTEVRSDRT